MTALSRRVALCWVVLIAGMCVAPAETIAQEAPIIPRAVLFGNPDRTNVRLSPNGKRISFLAPLDGVQNVFVAPVDDVGAAKPVTRDTKRGIRIYSWAFTSGHILYLQDEGGNENYNLFRVDLASGESKNLTPNPKVRANIEAVSHEFPEELLVGINDRDPRFHDVHRINLMTGERKLVAEHPGKIGDNVLDGFIIDEQFRVRLAEATTPDGGTQLYRRTDDGQDGAKLEWEPTERISMEDSAMTSPRGFDKSGKVLYMTDSRGRNTSALFAVDLGTHEKKLLAEDARADIGGTLMHPTENTVQAVSIDYDRQVWKVLDPALAADFEYLTTVADGDFVVASRTLDDQRWIVNYRMDNGPTRYYLYERTGGQKKATFLFSGLKKLEGLALQKMHPLVIKARDGLEMVSYLTLPAGAGQDGEVSDAQGKRIPKPQNPVPVVLLVHGGPWGRDGWGYDPRHQWLANRGYAVLSVNFRASMGFGKAFLNAGNREWGAKMHEDLIDAVNFVVEKEIARRDKVAIMGGSYGGYATLAGLTFTPDVFACGVDIVGPSNLVTLLKTIPPYWASGLANLRARMGDESTEEGRAFLASRSPLTYADRIKKPLLIGQGKNDPRVKEAEADQIVNAMQSKKLAVTYVLYPDEGHGFARPPNRMSFNAVAELFLAEHLGGRAEPVGDDFDGSSITVPVGAEHVKGLKEALEKSKVK